MSNKIKWYCVKECELNPEYDLCGMYNKKYVDIIRNIYGKWSALFNNEMIKENLNTRSEAKEYVEEYVKSY